MLFRSTAVVNHVGPEDASSIPRFLAEVWPHFAGNSPVPYWNMPWDSINVPGFNIESFSSLSNVRETQSSTAEGSNPTSSDPGATSSMPFQISPNTVTSNLGSSSVPFVGSVSSNDVPIATSNYHVNGNHASSGIPLSTERIVTEDNFGFGDQHFAPDSPADSPEPSEVVHFENIHDEQDVIGPTVQPSVQTSADSQRDQIFGSPATLINPPRKRQRLIINTQEAFSSRLKISALGRSPKLSSTLPVSSE